VPILVDLPTPLMDLPFPQRLIDVLGNRMSIDSYTFEYYQQTARVNEAAPVADLALKPTSTFTVEAVSGRAQIIATLSQPCPVRIYWHFQDLVDWLYVQAYGSVMDAVEQQVISGNGVSPNRPGS
jgi:phage tail protein X